MIAASALSGVASAACQYAMQRIGTPAPIFTLEMAFVAIPALLVSQAGLIAEDPAVLFRGWDARTLIPVFASAFGGICVGQVTKNLGGIAKGSRSLAAWCLRVWRRVSRRAGGWRRGPSWRWCWW